LPTSSICRGFLGRIVLSEIQPYEEDMSVRIHALLRGVNMSSQISNFLTRISNAFLGPGAYRSRQRCYEHHDIELLPQQKRTLHTHRRERSREGRAIHTWDAAHTSAQRRPKRGIWTLRYMNGLGNMLVTLT
jgi:hypothetical protein